MPRKTRNGLPPPRKRPEKFASERDEQDDTLRVLREVDFERKQHGNQQSARIGDDRKKVQQWRAWSFQPQNVQHPGKDKGEARAKRPESRQRKRAINPWYKRAVHDSQRQHND